MTGQAFQARYDAQKFYALWPFGATDVEDPNGQRRLQVIRTALRPGWRVREVRDTEVEIECIVTGPNGEVEEHIFGPYLHALIIAPLKEVTR